MLKFSKTLFRIRVERVDKKREKDVTELQKDWKRKQHASAYIALCAEKGKAPPPDIAPPKKLPFECSPGKRLNVAEVGFVAAHSGPCEEPYVEPTESMAIRAAYRLLDRLRPISNNRTARCRRFRLHKTVQVLCDGVRAWVTGVQSCNNVWGCPVCATIIQSRRAAEIDSAIEQWIGYGSGRRGPTAARAYMLTLTIRHAIYHDLKQTSQLIADAWSEMFAGRAGQALRAKLGMRHFVRALEPTYGENGWHPHLHCILFTNEALTPEQEQELRDRWSECLELCAPGEAQFQPNETHGVKLRELHQSRDGRYVSKMFLELQSYASKEALNGNLTYWQLARKAADGDRRFVHVWKDAQHALFGRKQLTWSHGCRRYFNLPDLTDEDILDEDGIAADEKKDVFRLEILGHTWDQAWRADRCFLSTMLGLILEAVQSGNYQSVIRLATGRLTRQAGGKPCKQTDSSTRVVPAASTTVC